MTTTALIENPNCDSRFNHFPGDEPIRGYRLVAPLGVGGFGEVWRCQAPGGFFKAMKIVGLASLPEKPGRESAAEYELAAINRLREIRHPFLISVERVDHVDGELIIVMELADTSLFHSFERCRRDGQPGIAADVLLHHLAEAAEVLDLMNFQHGLQHLDVKPANLLISNGHIKLADFGLVSSVERPTSGQPISPGCFTPQYAAPELLQGSLSRFCDQYSLAVTYQELLTGRLPYEGGGLLKRLIKSPQLESLPELDRPVLARALSANPEERWPSCTEFVKALVANRVDSQSFQYSRLLAVNVSTNHRPTREYSEDISFHVRDSVEQDTLTETPLHPIHTRSDLAIDTADVDTVQQLPDLPDANVASTIYPPTIHVSDLKWRPDPSGEFAPPAFDELIAQLIESATGQIVQPNAHDDIAYDDLPGQVIEHSFIIGSVSAHTARRRFEQIVSACRGELLIQSKWFVVFAVEVAVPFWKLFRSSQRILKVTVQITTANPEDVEFVEAKIRIEPLDRDGDRLDSCLLKVRPMLLRNIRAILEVAPDRRRNRRWTCDLEATLYPLVGDWRFAPPIETRITDLSAQGIGLAASAAPAVKRYYLRPHSCPPLSDYAIMVEVVRSFSLLDRSFTWGGILGRV